MRDAHRSPRPLSRRRFVTGLATGAGALALGGLGFSAAPVIAQTIQFGGTPESAGADPSGLAGTPPAGESVAGLASHLGFDQQAIIAFVRDEIAYEAYDGILRGAQGTLSARAGNSADQAVLLGALLATAGVTHRFVAGSLDPAQEGHLLAALERTPDTVQDAYLKASEGAARQALGLAPDAPLPETPDAAAQAVIDSTQPSAEAALDLARASEEISTRTIIDALAGAGIALPPLAEPALPELERSRHVWIQIADGLDWIDVDPSLPEDAGGPPAPSLTVDEAPDDWHHWITVAIEGEVWRGGVTVRERVASLDAISSRLAPVPVAVGLTNADALTDTGFAISQVVAGTTGFYPWIYADALGIIADAPILVTTDAEAASESLGPLDVAGGPRDGESVAVWLVVEVSQPGRPPVLIERTLLDRVPPEQRLAGAIDPAGLLPLDMIDTETGSTLRELDRLTMLTTEVARTPSLFAMTRFANDQVFGPVGTVGPTLGDLRTALGALSEEANGTWSYPSAPNLTAFTIESAGEEGARVTLDLLHRQRTVLPISGAGVTGDVHPLVRAGVLDAVAEQALLAPDPAGVQPLETGPSIGGIFAAAAEDGIPVRVLASEADLAGLALDPGSERLVTQALAGGNVVIVPERPVDLGSGPGLGWWIVNLATGEVRDQLQDGTAGASFSLGPSGGGVLWRAPMSEYAKVMVTFENFIVRHSLCLMGLFSAHIMFRTGLILIAAGAGAYGIGALAGGGVGGGIAIGAC